MSLASRYVGIINQGSTCYLNSVIQTLFHLPYFRRKVFSLQPKDEDVVLKALRNLFAELEGGNKNITTTELTAAFGWSPRAAAVQHDVHELIQQLFDTIETIVKNGAEETLIRDLFGGTQVYRSTATDGAVYCSDRLEGFYDLELIVEKKESIEESLEAMTAPERIEGVSVELAPGAPPTKLNIERTLRLLQLPPILLVHPNRVSFDMETFEPITLSNRWTFGVDLDVAPYLADSAGLRLDKESTDKRASLMKRSSSVPQFPTSSEYQLRSVLVHAGDATVGHYYVYVCFGDNQWVCFNDDLVQTATVEEVERAAFGGVQVPVYGGRMRPFGSERASMLVYVNRACAEPLLAEEGAPQEILALAKQFEEERNERWKTKEVQFLVADATYMDILDRVPGSLAPLIRSVRVSASSTQVEITAAIAKAVGLAPDDVRLLPSCAVRPDGGRILLVECVPEAARRERQAALENIDVPDAEIKAFLFGYLRLYLSIGQLDPPYIFHSLSDLKRKLPKDCALYVLSQGADDVYRAEALRDLQAGCSLVGVRHGLKAADVLQLLASRQMRKTQIFYVDPMNRRSASSLFALPIADSTTYTEIQRIIYKACRADTKLLPALPPSADHLAFYQYDTYREVMLDSLAPLNLSIEGATEEVTLGLLCGRWRTRKLFVTSVPIPVKSINVEVRITLRMGWGESPPVYMPVDKESFTFGELLAEALRQVGDRMSDGLRRRFIMEKAQSTGPSAVARLLEVKDGLITRHVSSLESPVLPHGGRAESMLVIDPLPALLEGFTPVNVFFCSRRRGGEEYFGYPTSILVSRARSESGSDLLLRVARKLSAPLAGEAVKRWMLYVKKPGDAKTIKLCEHKEVLKDILKGIDGKTFEFLVDRPVAAEVDGLEAGLLMRQGESGGIVIRSSSTADLSSL